MAPIGLKAVVGESKWSRGPLRRQGLRLPGRSPAPYLPAAPRPPRWLLAPPAGGSRLGGPGYPGAALRGKSLRPPAARARYSSPPALPFPNSSPFPHPSSPPHPLPLPVLCTPPVFTPSLLLHPSLPFLPILLSPLYLHPSSAPSLHPFTPSLRSSTPFFSPSLHPPSFVPFSSFYPGHPNLPPYPLLPIILPFRTSSPSPAPSFSFPPVTFPSYPLSASFLYFLSSLIPLLFLSPVPPSFPPPFVNRDERNPGPRPPPASSSLPGIQSQSRGPRLQRPTWERLRAPSPGHSWPLERSQFSKGLALACRVEAASLLLPFQGLGFEGRVLSRS